MLERTLWTLNFNSFECGAVCEQLVLGFGQWIHRRIIINLSFACIILFYDIIAYYIISSFIDLQNSSVLSQGITLISLILMMASFGVFITGMQADLSPKGLEMSSKPPLGSGLGIRCAAKLWVVATIPTKIIFTSHSTNPCRFKLTVSVDWTVSVQAFMKVLPERHRQILAHVSPGVDVFHSLALASPNIIDDVEVLEISTQVVSEIDAVGRIAACCSPVGGVSLQWSHSGQTQSVLIPVLGVLIHWRVYLEGNFAEFWKTSISRAPWHHQSPCGAWLRLQVTVNCVTVSIGIVKLVDAIFRASSA